MALPDAQNSGSIMWWGLVPSAWERRAGKLRHSVEFLWIPLKTAIELSHGPERPFTLEELALWDHIYAFLVVAGASLEAMFKAAAMQAEVNKHGGLGGILDRSPDLTLKRWILTHKSGKLADRAGVTLSPDERTRLERFEKYVIWAGRYPVPTDIRDPQPNAVSVMDHIDLSGSDYIAFTRLYELAHESYRHHAAEWQRGQPPPDESAR